MKKTINPFTASASKTSGLKDARTRLKRVYIQSSSQNPCREIANNVTHALLLTTVSPIEVNFSEPRREMTNVVTHVLHLTTDKPHSSQFSEPCEIANIVTHVLLLTTISPFQFSYQNLSCHLLLSTTVSPIQVNYQNHVVPPYPLDDSKPHSIQLSEPCR